MLNSPSAKDKVSGKDASRFSELTPQAISTGLLAAIVGFTSSFAVILQGLRAAGASEAEATSGLIVLTIGMGVSGILLAWRYKMPIGVAWSTPGAALLVVSAGTLNSFNEAVGAFIVSAFLLVLAGWFRPLGRLIGAIPTSLANAMLAGVLLTLCLAPVKALVTDAWLAVPLLLTWWLVGRINRYLAVPSAFLMLFLIVFWQLGVPEGFIAQLKSSAMPQVIWIEPNFSPQVIISVAIPLFVVTMASQNVPGVAVLKASGYHPESGPLIMNTGFFSVLTAPFGGHGINLAAITAAMMCSPDAHENPSLRYWSALTAGIAYVVLGSVAGVVVLLITLVPSILIEAIAGLALLGSFASALYASLEKVEQRESSVVTFLFAGSGLAFWGIGGAFWGLLAGGLMYFVASKKSSLL